MQQKNLFLFVALALLVIIGYGRLRQELFRPAEGEGEKAAQVTAEEGKKAGKAAAPRDGARLVLGAGGALALAQKPEARRDVTRGLALGAGGALAHRQKPPARRVAAAAVTPPTPEANLIRIGHPAGGGPSRYHLGVTLDPRGAGVHQLVLYRFAAASKMGLPEWENEAQRIPKPLNLIPAAANTDTPAFALYAYDLHDPSDERPLDTLGHAVWSVVGDKEKPVVEETAPDDGRPRQRVSFRTEAQGVTVTKTFTLTEGDYHLGLEVRLSKRGEPSGEREFPFRYQLAGGRGLPVEGVWYTSTFRNALIARVDGKGGVYRDLQDLRQIIHWDGGNEVVRDKDHAIRYAAEAVQYFASVIAADVNKEQPHPDFLARARPTLETAVVKGRVKSISADKRTVVLATGEHDEQAFYVPPSSNARLEIDVGRVAEGSPVAVVYRTDGVLEEGKLRHVAEDFPDQAQTQPLWVSDITLRVMTEPIDLKPGVDVVHRYVLYNGPVKVMLLGQLTGEEAVPPAVVHHYLDDLHLDTLTDYQSPGIFGTIASYGWSQLIVKCTNLMHEVLFLLHRVIPNYGLCIILLTVMVRGIMFPISRKQAMTSIRMQELAPELKKLQEKYKDDRQALGVAQMELYRKYGVNPFGTCWFLLLQMPIFMGLYYCLQESIHFRLAPFWPTWIINLAAPDMLIPWTDKIPIISRPEDYGGFLYLGPFFNLLPVVAVSLMVVQQKYTMPPPTDEQQAMQQNMMKYMMIFFGLMFYKVAAGLCVYFIASSLWGFAERKLLPKKKPADGTAPPPAEGLLQRIMKRDDNAPAASSTAVATAAPGQQEPRGGKRRKGKRLREDGAARGGAGGGQDQGAPGGIRGWWQVRKEKLAAWWEEVLRQAAKKR